MAIHKLEFEDFQEDNFSLIAIHSNEQDYRLAFSLNKYLMLKLRRTKLDVDFQYTNASFSLFEWFQPQQQTTWNLVSNNCKRDEESVVSAGTLFDSSSNTITRTYHLLEQFMNVDYLLKIACETNSVNAQEVTESLVKIPEVRMAYEIQVDKINTKENLIFK